MQKTIFDKQGIKMGYYFPITCRMVLNSGRSRIFSKQEFKDYCLDLSWECL